MRLAAELDAGFDVAIEDCGGVEEALRRLPSSRWDLFVVLSEGGRAPGLDLVRLLESHALHGSVPVLFVGPDEDERRAALAAGAERAVAPAIPTRDLAQLVTELLDAG
jgi:DNA-binding NarL/FixJ family response regulator